MSYGEAISFSCPSPGLLPSAPSEKALAAELGWGQERTAFTTSPAARWSLRASPLAALGHPPPS